MRFVMSYSSLITKQNLDTYFFELAKEYKTLTKKKAIPLEIVLIGGASILVNYGFRNSTTDVDALFPPASEFKQAIKKVANQNNLPLGWLNADFMKSASYSDQLREHSVFYKDYLNLLYVRTIQSEYLIAMKLVAGRMHKNDLSDIVGILSESQKKNEQISKAKIEAAVLELYGTLNRVEQMTWLFLDQIIADGDYDKLYSEYRAEEVSNRASLIDFEKNEHPITPTDNLKEILDAIKKSREKQLNNPSDPKD